jgi:uncharacterized protein involved in propanediol utilization
MQAPLNFPDARRDRLHDPNTKILFKRRNDTERVQVRRQDVNGIRICVLEKLPLDKGVGSSRVSLSPAWRIR